MSNRPLDHLLVLSGAAALLGAFIVEFSVVGFVPFFLIFLVPPMALAVFLAFSPRRWLAITTAVIVLLVAAAFLSSSGAWLVQPYAFAGAIGYTGVVLMALATLLALLGLVGALMGRSDAPSWRQGWPAWRNLVAIAALGVAAGMVVTATFAVSNPLRGEGYALRADATAHVTLAEGDGEDDVAFFSPAQVPLQAGQVVEVSVTNAMDVMTTFVFQGPDGEYAHDIPGGTTAHFLVRFPAPTQVEFRSVPLDPNTDAAVGSFLIT